MVGQGASNNFQPPLLQVTTFLKMNMNLIIVCINKTTIFMIKHNYYFYKINTSINTPNKRRYARVWEVRGMLRTRKKPETGACSLTSLRIKA